MYAVIFRARIKEFDEDYGVLAARLRKRAQEEYGCLEFVSLAEGREEVAISYWESEEQIRAWKRDPEHIRAQQLGREKWYESYSVQVTKLVR